MAENGVVDAAEVERRREKQRPVRLKRTFGGDLQRVLLRRGNRRREERLAVGTGDEIRAVREV